jgi:osmotically-inducible protein OsmY
LLDETVLPDAAEVGPVCSDGPSPRGAQQQALEIAIQQRIESRLQGRVRNLRVRASGDLVILDGQCATYYTKQLAQHAAMGVLEDEQLENAIVVSVPQ